MAGRIGLQGLERAGGGIDAVGRELMGTLAGGENEFAGGIDGEGAGCLLRGGVSEGRDFAGGLIDGVTGEAVVAAIGGVEEFAVGRDVDVGAGVLARRSLSATWAAFAAT